MAVSKESHRSFDISFKLHAVQVAEETSKSNASHFILPPCFKKCYETFEMERGMCPTILPSLVNDTAYLSYRLPSSISAGSISPINGVHMVL